jgi:hypothetical protein
MAGGDDAEEDVAPEREVVANQFTAEDETVIAVPLMFPPDVPDVTVRG